MSTLSTGKVYRNHCYQFDNNLAIHNIVCRLVNTHKHTHTHMNNNEDVFSCRLQVTLIIIKSVGSFFPIHRHVQLSE